jgi:uncharacterized protein (TIGR03435 family)
MSVLCRAAAFLLVVFPAVAQSQSFTTITIKPAASADPRNASVKVLPNGDLIARAVSVATLLSKAYDVPFNGSPLLSPVLPDWTIAEKYDIDAKAPANAILPSSLQESELRSAIQQMIRGLLADRFGLVMRVENKTMSVYALTVASGGPNLQKLAITEKACTFYNDDCHSFVGGFGHPLNAKAIDMDDLVHYIGNWTDLAVVNRTGLSGLFTVSTEDWFPMRLPPPPPGVTPTANPFASLPTIFTVLGKIGLELKRKDATLLAYTVEHIERPAVN